MTTTYKLAEMKFNNRIKGMELNFYQEQKVRKMFNELMFYIKENTVTLKKHNKSMTAYYNNKDELRQMRKKFTELKACHRLLGGQIDELNDFKIDVHTKDKVKA